MKTKSAAKCAVAQCREGQCEVRQSTHAQRHTITPVSALRCDFVLYQPRSRARVCGDRLSQVHKATDRTGSRVTYTHVRRAYHKACGQKRTQTNRLQRYEGPRPAKGICKSASSRRRTFDAAKMKPRTCLITLTSCVVAQTVRECVQAQLRPRGTNRDTHTQAYT
jgi:hypothetical protein